MTDTVNFPLDTGTRGGDCLARLSWDELMAHIESPQRSARFSGRASEITKRERGKFYALENWGAMDKVAHSGWEAGLRMVRPVVDSVTRLVRTERVPYERRDVAGERPNVPLAAAGDPLSMWRKRRDVSRSRPVVRFVNNVVCPHFIDEANYRNRGAAIMGWAMGLEAAGISTSIETLFASGSGNCKARFYVTVKEARDGFDVDRLAFALVCPDYMRRAMFSLLERCGDLDVMSSGYGGCFDPPKEDPRDVYIPAMFSGHGYGTTESAVREIKAKIIEANPDLATRIGG